MIRLAWQRQPAALRFGLAVTAGLAWGLSFPEPGWWWCAVPALALWWALACTARREAALREGAVVGFVAYGVMLRWFQHPIEHFSSLGSGFGWFAVLMAALAAALIYGAFTAVLAACTRRAGAARALWLAPALWTGWEVAREWLPLPFPWGTLAGAHAEAAFAAPVAALCGACGLSLALAGCAALLTGVIIRSSLRAALAVGAAPLLLLIPALLGVWIQDHLPPGQPLRVAVMQAAIAREDAGPDKLEAYWELSLAAARDGAQLLVWPESATGYDLEDPGYLPQLRALCDGLELPLVLNAVTRHPAGGWQNSAVLIEPHRGVTAIAPKRVLVPFGEYLPARPLFGSLPALAVTADFIPGSRVETLSTGRVTIGPLLCFESVFPQLALELSNSGATLLVNQTNDSWFGRTGGPHQHLLHGLLRAAETGRPLARAANTGISVLIARNGRRLGSIPLMQRGVLVGDLELGGALPPGAVVGRVLAGACVMLAAAFSTLWLLGAWRERRDQPRRLAVLPLNRHDTAPPRVATSPPEAERGDDA